MIRVFVRSTGHGCGSTTVAANLGVNMARAGVSVLLRGQANRSLGAHFNALPDRDASGAAYRAEDKLVRDIEPHLKMSKSEGSPSRSTAIQQADGSYDIELNDTGRDDSLSSASADDWLLIVTRPDAHAYRELALTLERLVGGDTPTTQARPLVLLNHHVPEQPLANDVLTLMQSSLGPYLYQEPLLSDTALAEAYALGLPVVEHAPWSPFQSTIERLAEYLVTSDHQRHAAA